MKNLKKDCSYRLKQAILFPISFIKLLSLKHSEVIRRFVIAVILYIIFVVLDIVSKYIRLK